MKKIKINMQLLPMKVHYFLWHGGAVPLLPFMSIYAKQLGFSGYMVGLVYALFPIVILLLTPLAGGVADKYKIQKAIFLGMQVLGCVSVLGLMFLPALPASVECGEHGDNGSVSCMVSGGLGQGYQGLQMNCQSSPPNQTTDFVAVVNLTNLLLPVSNATFCPESADNLDSTIYQYHQFWTLTLVYFLIIYTVNFVITTADTVCLQILGDKHNKYGSQRLFGSLGWALFGFLAGNLVNMSGGADYTPAFGMALGVWVLSVVVSYKLKYTQPPHKPNLVKDITTLLQHPRIIIFFTWVTFFGVACGLFWHFGFWLLEEIAGSNSTVKTIEGLSLTVESLSGEVPFYFFSTWLYKRLSYVNAMTVVSLVIGVRFILYSMMKNPWMVLGIAVLSGVSNGGAYSSMAAYASLQAPRGSETTTQGLVTSCMHVGTSIGSLAGGMLIGSLGINMTFRVFGLAAIVLGGFHAAAHFVIGRLENAKEKVYQEINLIETVQC